MALTFSGNGKMPIFARCMQKCDRSCLLKAVKSCVEPVSSAAMTLPFQIIAHRFKTTSRTKCFPHAWPKCNPVNVKESHCMKMWNLRKTHKSLFRDLLWNDVCCDILCPEVSRFDHMYYAPSDKFKRRYQRTWAICRDPIKVKPVCDKIKIIPPRYKKRRFHRTIKGKCFPVLKDTSLMKCHAKIRKKCPKFMIRGCHSVRRQFSCLKVRKPWKCNKVCTPYPAFSECDHKKLRERRRCECLCLAPRSMCETYRYLRKHDGKLPKY